MASCSLKPQPRTPTTLIWLSTLLPEQLWKRQTCNLKKKKKPTPSLITEKRFLQATHPTAEEAAAESIKQDRKAEMNISLKAKYANLYINNLLLFFAITEPSSFLNVILYLYRHK